MGLMMMGRLFYLQILQASDLKEKAKQSHRYSVSLVQRGQIKDRNSRPLAQDGILYDLYVHPRFYGQSDTGAMAAAMAPVLAIPEEKLVELLNQRRKSTIRLANNLTKETMDRLEKIKIRNLKGKLARMEGLDFARKTIRQYPQGDLAAHVLGYVNQDARYSSGIELAYDSILGDMAHAKMGGAMLDGRAHQIDLNEQPVASMVMVPKADDVTLTIDTRLQFIAEKALKKGVERSGGQRGAVIMMTPQTGEVLAYAVYPSYNPEQYFKVEPTILKNWSMTDVYPPGSTMKILTVANGLEAGVIKPDSTVLDTGRMRVGGWPIENYDYYRHPYPGPIDLVYLFEHSSNIGSARISMMMSKKQQYQLLTGFGFGQKTGIELPGESSGILPKPSTWEKSSQASMGYGYGVAATPLQMAAAVNAIANKGVWVQPHVVQKDKTQVKEHRVVSESVAEATADLLTRSIQHAKTSSVRLPGILVAGKTGTSRKPNASGGGYSKDIFTSFAGFYPAKNPKVLVFVVVDSPSMYDAWGSTVAGPIFKQIAEESLDYLDLRPKTAVKKENSEPILSEKQKTA